MIDPIDNTAYQLFCLGKTLDQIPIELTRNEQKVLNMLNASYTIDSIADRLKIQRTSVENYIYSLKAKEYL